MQNKYDALMALLQFRYVQADRRTFPAMDVINTFENSIGFVIPHDYKEFLLKYGVTGSNTGRWLIRDESGKSIGGVDVFLGLSPKTGYDLANERRHFADVLPVYILPLATSSGGMLCMSLKDDDTGSIYWWDPQEPFIEGNIEFMAKDFDTFMHSLYIDKE